MLRKIIIQGSRGVMCAIKRDIHPGITIEIPMESSREIWKSQIYTACLKILKITEELFLKN